MKHKYDILIRVTIELGGVFEANSAEEALEMCKLELKANGELGEVEVERCIVSDDEDLLMAETGDLPREAYDPQGF